MVYRGSKCDNCEHVAVCKKFSDMSFSFLIPKNSMIAPFTAKACKACETEHPIMDTIMENGILRCSKCGGRMETLKGIIDRDDFSSVKIPHSITTHTAIDLHTRTADNGSLFSVEAIKKGSVYECEIDDCDSSMLYDGKTVYIGKYSSCGYGKIRITSIDDIPEYDVKNAISKFNERFKCNGERKYAAILLLSDAKLDIDRDGNAPKTTAEYKRIWKERLFGMDAPVEVEQIFAQNYWYNGYEMSDGDYRIIPEMLTEKGSSIKVSFATDNEKAVDFLEKLQKNGIGRDTNIGYGKIQVCGKIHRTGIGGTI